MRRKRRVDVFLAPDVIISAENREYEKTEAEKEFLRQRAINNMYCTKTLPPVEDEKNSGKCLKLLR